MSLNGPKIRISTKMVYSRFKRNLRKLLLFYLLKVSPFQQTLSKPKWVGHNSINHLSTLSVTYSPFPKILLMRKWLHLPPNTALLTLGKDTLELFKIPNLTKLYSITLKCTTTSLSICSTTIKTPRPIIPIVFLQLTILVTSNVNIVDSSFILNQCTLPQVTGSIPKVHLTDNSNLIDCNSTTILVLLISQEAGGGLNCFFSSAIVWFNCSDSERDFLITASFSSNCCFILTRSACNLVISAFAAPSWKRATLDTMSRNLLTNASVNR